MNKQSHNQAALEIKESLPDFYAGEEFLTCARKTLYLVGGKQIAAELEVSESLVSQWGALEKPIPTDRMYQIIKAGKAYCQDVQAIENEIDMMLMLNFGRKIEG